MESIDKQAKEAPLDAASSGEIGTNGSEAAKHQRPWAKAVCWGAAAIAACSLVAGQAWSWTAPRNDAAVGQNDSDKQEATASASSSYAQDNAQDPAKKTETVHVDAAADGTPKDTTVSTALANDNGSQYLADSTILSNIADVKGADDWSDDDGHVVWADASDTVSYTGTTDKQAPVAVNISYKLDGQNISPDDLAGKSGHVTMRVDYQNLTGTTANVDGQQVNTITPFVCATAFQLDNDVFSNVEVTNGKVAEAAGRTVVAGYALPGFSDALGVDMSDSDTQVPEYFEVDADVQNFKLGPTVTYATSDVFSNVDEGKLDTSDTDETLNTLQTSMDALVDGGDSLSTGLAKLAAGGGTIESGAEKLAQGASTLSAGTSKLNASVGALPAGTQKLSSGAAQLSAGVTALSDGLSTMQNSVSGLPDSTSKLNQGASQLAGALGSKDDTAANKTLLGLANTASNGEGQLEAGLDKLNEQLASTSDQANSIEQLSGSLSKSLPSSKDVDAAKKSADNTSESVESAKKDLESVDTSGLSDEDAAKVKKALSSLDDASTSASKTEQSIDGIDLDEASSDAEKLESSAETLSKSTSSAQSAASNLANASKQIRECDSAIVTGLNSASQGAQSLSKGTSQLAASSSALTDGVDKLAAGSQSAASGAQSLATGNAQLAASSQTLASGVGQLDAGAQALNAGTAALADGVPQLTTGLQSAYDGSIKLSDGLQKFNNEGISVLVNKLGGNLDSGSLHMKAMVQQAKAYDTFAGKSADTQGSVKFIIKTDKIG